MHRNALLVVGSICLGLTALAPTQAQAQYFDGWGWFGFSDVRGEITTGGTPPPGPKPSVLIVNAAVTVQIACVNPADNGIFNGKAFKSDVLSAQQITQGNITDKKGNTAITTVLLNLDHFEVGSNCTNTSWTPLVDSAIVSAFSHGVSWYECTGEDLDGNGDFDPCFDTNPATGETVLTIGELLASATGNCTLDMEKYPRNADGTAPHEPKAVFDCTPPPGKGKGRK
jgi:hypothetical protein